MSIIASAFVLPVLVFSGVGIKWTPTAYTGQISLWIIKFLVALAEGVIAITASGFCCRVVCCGSKKMETRSVLYSPTTLGNPQFSPVPMNVLPTAIPQGQGPQGNATT